MIIQIRRIQIPTTQILIIQTPTTQIWTIINSKNLDSYNSNFDNLNSDN